MNVDPVMHRERVYLVLVAAFSAVAYYLLTITVVGIVLALVMYLVFCTGRAIAMGYLRGNGVLATPEQFPELVRTAEEIALRMGMSRTPDIWIFQAGRVLGAISRRFVRRHHVVLASEIAELTWEGEDQARALRFLLAHEFAGIQRQFPLWGTLLAPGRFVPILGKAWSRAAHLTFDRMAATSEPDGVAPGLAVLSAGPRMFAVVDGKRFTSQTHRRGFWAWLFEIVSRQRPLARRLEHLGTFTSTQPGAGSSRTWDRTIAAALVLSAIPLGLVTLAAVGPDIYQAVQDEVPLVEQDLKDAFEAASGPEVCPPGTSYDAELDFCFTDLS